MAFQKKSLTDPVDEGKQEKELEQEMESFDLSKIKAIPIPQEAARASRPFDGYPLKYVGKGKERRCITHLVGYNHIAKPLRQDPSNQMKKNGDGKIVRILTYHNRMIRNPVTQVNEDVVFDRKIKTADGEFFFSLVPDPYVRAQVCFFLNIKKESTSIAVDTRYFLLDVAQAGPLKRCFEQVVNPQLKIERAANFISGTSTEGSPEEIPEEVAEG